MNINALFKGINESNLAVNSFILQQDGTKLAEFWRKPYRKDAKQLLYSLSKSFTSIAVGIACDYGFLSLEDQVISFFPDKLPPRISDNLASMTLHHLLAMNAGHHDNIYAEVSESEDWVRAFLSLEVEHEPGSFYRYSTPSTYVLAAIMEKATGQKLVDFLMPRLFEPLGITRPIWESCPMGTTAGGMGLSLSTEEIARFGQLLLNRGEYAGQRLVSEAFIEQATSEQSDNRLNEKRIDFAQGYGYQFFLCRDECFMGNGGFGQLCFVAPKKGIVIAATSSMQSMSELQLLLDLIYEHILKGRDHEGSSLVSEKLLEMTFSSSNGYPLFPQETGSASADCPDLSDACFLLNENPLGMQRLHFTAKKNELDLTIHFGDRVSKLLFNLQQPVHAEDIFRKDLSLHQQEVVTCAAWLSNDVLELKLFYIETPYRVTYTIAFFNERIEFLFDQNVSFGPTSCSFTGKFISSR